MNNAVLLSEMVAQTPAIGRQAGRIKPSLDLHSPRIRFDDSWRIIPLEKRERLSSKGGLPDVLPEATNGVIFLSLLNNDQFFGHVTNLIQPEKVQKFSSKPKEIKERKPRKTDVLSITLDELI